MKTARERGLKIAEVGVDLAKLPTTGVSDEFATKFLDGASEAEFHQLVTDEFEANGWAVAHCRKTLVQMGKKTHYETTMPDGWFDQVMFRAGVVLFCELKVGKNRRDAAQDKWAELAAAAAFDNENVEYRLWYPAQWPAIRDFARNRRAE